MSISIRGWLILGDNACVGWAKVFQCESMEPDERGLAVPGTLVLRLGQQVSLALAELVRRKSRPMPRHAALWHMLLNGAAAASAPHIFLFQYQVHKAITRAKHTCPYTACLQASPMRRASG